MSEENFKQPYYDLALAYAKIKLQKAIDDNTLRDDICPQGISEIEYLAKNFWLFYNYHAGEDPESSDD